MEAQIRAQLPDLDSVVVDYAAGYLNHAAHQFSTESDPLAEAASVITQLLLSASGDLSSENEVSVQNLVDKFVQRLQDEHGRDGEQRQQAPAGPPARGAQGRAEPAREHGAESMSALSE